MKFSISFEDLRSSADNAEVRAAAELLVCSSSSSDNAKVHTLQNLTSSSSSYTYLYSQ